MDAVKAMKDAVADADVDAEEEEAAEAASTFVPGETPVADQGSTMPSFLQLEHPTIGGRRSRPARSGLFRDRRRHRQYRRATNYRC